MDLYDTLLLAAWDRISDRVRIAGFPRERWEALVDGQWIREPVYGRPNMWLVDTIMDMIREGTINVADPAHKKVINRLMANSAYPRMNRLKNLLHQTGRWVP